MFDARYCNDDTGASAYHPGILLKVVLLGYSRGLTSSRTIAQACEENVLFMALAGDVRPHFTTMAAFIRQMPDQIFRCDSGLGRSSRRGVSALFRAKARCRARPHRVLPHVAVRDAVAVLTGGYACLCDRSRNAWGLVPCQRLKAVMKLAVSA